VSSHGRLALRFARSFRGIGPLFAAVLIFAMGSRGMQERDQEQCNLSKDLVVQALERVKTGTKDEAEDGLQLLKHATEVCISNGDAWYYRSVFEKERGELGNVQYALDKAKKFGSEAMAQGANPFHLATGGQAATATANTTAVPLGEKWALVIGISKFQDKHLPRLNFASKDAKDFSSLLLDPSVGRFKAPGAAKFKNIVTSRSGLLVWRNLDAGLSNSAPRALVFQR
jgi:hypothetical protein